MADSPSPAATAPLSPDSSLDSPASSSHIHTPSTTFTTPDIDSRREWKPSVPSRLADETNLPPSAFVHLDTEFAREVGHAGAARSFEWTSRASPIDSTTTWERRLGPTEASYYLGSRGKGPEGGVNDMYLHIGFRARPALVTESRVFEAWKRILARHPLLWSSACFSDYYDVHFVNRPPTSAEDFDEIVRQRLAFKTEISYKAVLDDYLNGDRTLSDERLAFLTILTAEPSFSTSEQEQEYDFLLYSTHFLGDGMALHSTANEFFTLLSSPSLTTPDPAALIVVGAEPDFTRFPSALESKVNVPDKWGRTAWSAARVDFERNERKSIGGHAFLRAKLGPRHTVVPTRSYTVSETTQILERCKAHSSTFSNAVFALSNLAYIRSTPEERRSDKLPVNLYSALNVRGFLKKEEARDWYHLAIGYYNIVLPSFVPCTIPLAPYFWSLAGSVKRQTSLAVKSPFLAARTVLMALERERRSIGFERADELQAIEARRRGDDRVRDEVGEGLKGLGINLDDGAGGDHDVRGIEEMRDEAQQAEQARHEREEAGKAEDEKVVSDKVPNVSLMGLSMLGNLDAMYKHASYGGIQLHTLTTGSRQRPGAVLLFAYTFAGKLFVSLGYDENGFERGVIERWWHALLGGIDELLLAPEDAVEGESQKVGVAI
ncbi:hypothetical protein JCM10212_004623 [Sporobolomyces blumeae]